ncbi:SPX domain-containing protein [Mycena maculata]|uniref:SPX domain-containing protein n=1 Tax=Mycena maculata TaxID=230809 RepID=A0AAD7NKT9_9AGAR|nr:SPX domain-containing protein [Mycena maculata]
MKFSSALKFNAVAEWWDEYIAYDALKKYIYQLEKTQHDQSSYHDLETNERASLVNRAAETDAVFVPLLEKELKKICAFYEAQEKELIDEVTQLEELVQQQDEAGMAGNHYLDGPFEDDEDEDEDEDSLSRSPRRRRRISSSAGHRMSLSASGSRAIPELAPHDHRRSISSTSSDGHLESPPVSPTAPFGKISRLANKLTPDFMRNSVSSTHDNVWMSKSDYAYDTRLLFKRRITTLYISVTSLKSYVEVNHSGFRKILKKYDKVTYRELKDAYLHGSVEPAPPFTAASRATLTTLVTRLVDLYAKCVTRGDRGLAKQQLRLHQRENIAWERDTVWRQMIGRERRGDGETLGPAGASLLKEEEEDSKPGMLFQWGPARFRATKKKIALLVAVAIFVALLNTQVVDVDKPEANRCFAVLIFCTVLWATEAIPLFVTSLMVPLLLVCSSVIRDDSEDPVALPPPAATKYIFSVMFSPTIMLLIGGFTISSALSKTNIDRVLITRVLSLAGTRPSTVLLAFMGVSCFASMWISNVAAPTLCFTLIRPILRNLPPKSSFAPCLILAIALAANIGGQSSPISSPQNLIAIGEMDPPVSWGQWFIVALPVSAISLLLIWGLLLTAYRPARSPDGGRDIEIKLIRPTRERFSLKQWWVTFVCLVTIALWCFAHQIEGLFGDMGVIAIIPIVAFFATGVLKKDDFEQFAWTIVFLAMGGIALGKGVTSSGLLEVLDLIIRDLLDGVSLYNVVLILSPVVLVISTFISHTIAAVLLVPIAKEVGASLPEPHRNLLIFITGLICSAGMGMPVSGFPNQTAATQEDEMGVLYLTNIDFLKNGVPASIIATLVVSTVGFLLMQAIGLK